MKVNFLPENNMFKIQSIVNAECQTIKEYKNATRGEPKDVIQNWDIIEMQFRDKKYAICLGYKAGEIMANYFRRISPKRN